MAEALRLAGLTIEIHDDHFAPDAPDKEWIRAASERAWIIFTKDQNIRYREAELMAVAESRARVFALVAGNIDGRSMAAIFLSAQRKMIKFIAENQAPFVAKLYRTGRVTMWVDSNDLTRRR